MKQCKLTASTLVLVSLLSSSAFADGFLENAHNWSGYYAGFNAGVVQHTMNITDNQATTFNATIVQAANPQPTIGFQIGYRRQMDINKTSGVYGVEFSANIADATFSKQYGSTFSLYQLNSKNKLENIYLLELIGGIAADKTLLFLAAGLSLSNISGSTTNIVSVPFFNSFSMSKKAIGTAIGCGIEYALSEALSARIKVDLIMPNSYSALNNTSDSYQISNSMTQGTFGLNYKFS